MSAANTLDTLNGLFKDVWAPKLENSIPDGVKLYNMIPFVPQADRTGNLYHQPVVLGLEHGVTFAASGEDAFNLNPAKAGTIKDATIQGTALVLRSVMGYQSAMRATKSGPQAFEAATKFLIGNMLRSITKKLEAELFYGQVGYGTVASTSGNVITITTAEWAPGIWGGGEGMPIEIRDSAGTTSRGEAEITAVDFDNRTITVNALPGGTTATDVIWHKGAYGNEFVGLHNIVSNTGTLFGISGASYALWKGNTFSAGSAALNFSKVQDAVARGVEKGLEGDVVVFVNPRSWADLLNDQAALRQYDSSYQTSVAENGARKIQFHGQNGMIEIIPSIYVKEGYAYLIDPDVFLRVGSQDVSFERPGDLGKYFRDLSDAHGFELRVACDQALFCNKVGINVLINNIVN